MRKKLRKAMPVRPQWLRAPAPQVRASGVDRQAKIIRGYVVALQGTFKNVERGEFDASSLGKIVELMKLHPAGLKSRFAHPTESGDGLGKFLGRARDPFLGTATVQRDGRPVEVPAVRADLHLSASAFEANPNGNLGEYVLKLAEEDPDALSSSLVLHTDKEFRRLADGTLATGPDGEALPPLWRPTALYASDIVDEGEAVDGLLSTGRWTGNTVRRAHELLDNLFAGQPRKVIRGRCLAWLDRYLDHTFGVQPMGKNCAKCGCGDKLGANLGGLLTDLVDQATSDEQPREVVMGNMAQEAGITVEEVNNILTGASDCPPVATLEAFSRVLESPLGDLITAAEQDGCDYSNPAPADGGAASGDAVPAPAGGEAPAPMANKRSAAYLRRRVEVKTGG